jgi:hypothetical protein
VYVAASDGSGVACVDDAAAGGAITWGPSADRLLEGDATIATPHGEKLTHPDDADVVVWSTPTGARLISATADGRLVKRDVDGAAETDVTFLSGHEDVAYHPSGKSFASVGAGADGYGVYLADNDGDPSRLLVGATTATSFHDIAFSASGTELYLVGDHETGADVRRLDLATNVFDTLFESEEELGDLVASTTADRAVAFREGACNGVVRTRADHHGTAIVVGADGTSALRKRSLVPAGWLGDGKTLAVLSREKGCDGPADLWLVDTEAGAETLFAAGVDAAAIRVPIKPVGDVPNAPNSAAPT